MPATLHRDDLIDRILKAAERPCPDIRECRMYRDPETGKTFLPNGIPMGMDRSRLVLTEPYYCFVDRSSGCTIGKRYASRAEAVESHRQSQERETTAFRAHLEAATDEELQSQADYWLK